MKLPFYEQSQREEDVRGRFRGPRCPWLGTWRSGYRSGRVLWGKGGAKIKSLRTIVFQTHVRMFLRCSRESPESFLETGICL